MLAHVRAETVRADEQPDEDETDDRGDAEAREQRDDDPRGPQDDKCVGQHGGIEFGGHCRHYGMGVRFVTEAAWRTQMWLSSEAARLPARASDRAGSMTSSPWRAGST